MAIIDFKNDIIKCETCGVEMNYSAFSAAQALYNWTEKHPCHPVKRDIDELLTTLEKHNVDDCALAHGELISVKFRMRFDHQPQPAPHIAAAMQQAAVQVNESSGQPDEFSVKGGTYYKDELLELALNPPSDIRHPVDDGKD